MMSSLEELNCPETIRVCRLCLNKHELEDLQNLFGTFELSNTTIAEYVMNFSKIEINENDNFSKLLCTVCFNNLIGIENFRKTILNSNQYLNDNLTNFNRNHDQDLELITLIKIEDNDNNLIEEEDSKIDILEHNLNENVKIEAEDEIIRSMQKKENYKYPNFEIPCKYCEAVFKTFSGRDAHTAVKHTGHYYICEICQEKFAEKFSYLMHQKLHADENLLKRDEYGKEECSTYYLEKHSNIKQYQCEQCGECFNSKLLFKYHKSTHLKKCGKLLKSKDGFKAHLKTHSGGLDFTCELCPKKYTSKRRLNYHMAVVHSTTKPYSCEVCGKTFALKTNWYEHGKMHAKQNLNEDMKIEHGVTENTDTKQFIVDT